MNTYADRIGENKSQAVANSISKKQGNYESALKSHPPEVTAHTYSQGSGIHAGSGHEKHLAYEAGHVVQQKQGSPKLLSAAGNSFPYQLLSISQTLQLHPLESDDATYNIEVLDALQELEKDATLRDLILQKTPNAKKIMKEYIDKRGKTGEADFFLLQSILATIELHTSGVWHEAVINENQEVLGEEEKQILSLMQIAYDQKHNIAKEYGLSGAELHAIECYTQPGKNKKDSQWYMGPAKKWDSYKNGWEALETALNKLPSLRDLGLEITTYRAIRTDDTSRKKVTGSGLDPTSASLSRLAPETNIFHGKDAIPPFGQKHYISTGITYTTSHMTEDRTGQGLVAMTGGSGKYIGPWNS